MLPRCLGGSGLDKHGLWLWAEEFPGDALRQG
nr:MAG TPA: hypothetical protein [Caudoviricetes sp.]